MKRAAKAPTHYLLDTNTVAYIVHGCSPLARRRLAEEIKHCVISVSVITEAEILYGLARKPQATRLRAAVEALFSTINVLPWNSDAARAYAVLRANLSASGKNLANMDMLIAAHAIATSAILVTSDKAFAHISAMHPTLNWATDL